MNKSAAWWLIAAAIVTSILFVLISSFRNLSTLENTLLQVISMSLGLVGSYVLGQASARDAAREMMKPHARSAFRRLVSLTQSLSRLVATLNQVRPNVAKNTDAIVIVDRIEGIVIEQIAVAADALEDWRDVIPEDLEALRASKQPQHDTLVKPL